MRDISQFLNLAEAVNTKGYTAVPVSDAELAECIAEANVQIGFAIGAESQIEGAVNKMIVEGIASNADFNEFVLREAFAPTGFLKKVIDFFVGLWRKLVSFIKGIVGNLFASGSKMREKVSYMAEVGGRVKSRKYANTTTVKYKSFMADGAEKAMNVAAKLIVAANYYEQPLEEGKTDVTFTKVNDMLENLGQNYLTTYNKHEDKGTHNSAITQENGKSTAHGVGAGASADVQTNQGYTGKQQNYATKDLASDANKATNAELTKKLEAFKEVERKLGDGEKGSIEILRLVLKAKLGDNNFKTQIDDKVKEKDSVKKFTNELKESYFPNDWKELEATSTGPIQGLATTVEKIAETAKGSGIDSILTKEVEALDAKATRMESIGKQLENGAKLDNAAGTYNNGNDVVENKDAGKTITEIAQLAQKVGSKFSAAINAGISVATGLYMESINEGYALASALDKAPIIAN